MRRQRFSNEFYQDAWRFSGYDRNIIKQVCEIINEKQKELCGLVSTHGALKIIMNEVKD